ncbi:MAG: nucleotide exchange factor GrpE [Patescibacteria group bacterium]
MKKQKNLEKIKDLEEKLKRALADYDNLEKRVLRERQNFTERANASLLDKVLASVDDLDLCQKHLKDKGLKIALESLMNVLESEGVEKMRVKGVKFDPEKMDAIEAVEGKKNKVVEVVNSGYLLNNSVLRPAKVKVGAGERK